MEIKDARIVTAFLKKKGDLYEFLLDIDLYDGIRYVAPYLLITHEELCTFFDVVGVRSGVSVRNTPIRVLGDDKGEVLLVGNSMDNKWVDLKSFEIMRVKGETVVPHTEDNEKERWKNTMKTNDNAEYIYEILKDYDDKLRQRRLDPDYIATMVEQAEDLIYRETDVDCMLYIAETFVEKISEHFYLGLNVKKYVTILSEDIGVLNIGERRALALRAIGLVVFAGCTGDYPSITNQ